MDNFSKLLPWPVGFELEWAQGTIPSRSTPTREVARVLRDHGLGVHDAERWRRTPQSLTHWDIKTDSSCGYEACSPVIETYDELAKACSGVHLIEASGAARITRSCGLHVHVGIGSAMSPEVLESVIKFLYRYEAAFYLIVPDYRRVNRYCRPINVAVVDAVRKNRGDVEIASIWGSKDTWVNFIPLGRIGTVEFRFMEGTLSAATVYAYCLFLSFVMDVLIRGAKNGRWGRASAKDDWMLFYTMLQQCGMYGRITNDKVVIARKWASHRFRLFNPNSKRGDGGGVSTVLQPTDTHFTVHDLDALCMDLGHSTISNSSRFTVVHTTDDITYTSSSLGFVNADSYI